MLRVSAALPSGDLFHITYQFLNDLPRIICFDLPCVKSGGSRRKRERGTEERERELTTGHPSDVLVHMTEV